MEEPFHGKARMPTTHEPPHPHMHPDTSGWFLEDIQIRKLVRLNPPTNDTTTHMHQPTREANKTKTLNINTAMDTTLLEKEQTALRRALNLSRLEEEEAEAVRRAIIREQERVERSFVRKTETTRVKDKHGNLKTKHSSYKTEDEWEYLLGSGNTTTTTTRDRDDTDRKSKQAEAEREKTDALRRAVEEELYRLRKERVLREQAERERELKLQQREEQKKREREREEVVRKMKELELEEAAVAKAVEESLITEAARRLVDKERERKKVEEMAERMRREAEAKEQEERLRRRVRGKAGTAGGEPSGMFGPGVTPLIGDGRAFEERQRTPWGPINTPDTTTYAAGGWSPPAPPYEQTWAGYAPPLNRAPRLAGETKELRHCWGGYDSRLDEPGTLAWSKPGKGNRRWHETTTERWEAVVERDGEGQDEYQRFKEVSKIRRPL